MAGLRSNSPTGLVHHWSANSVSGLADGASITSLSDTGSAGTTLTPTSYAAPTKTTVNGKPGMLFNGTSQAIKSDSSPVLAQPHTVVVCVSAATTSSDRQIFWQGAGGEMQIYTSKWSSFAGAMGSINSPLPVVNQVTILTTDFNSSDSAQFVNGTQALQANLGTGAMTAGQIVLGNNPGATTRWWSGVIYAVRVYNKLLSSSEKAIVHSEMQDDFGGTTSDYVAAAGGMKQRRGGVWSTAKYKKNGVWTTGPKIRKNGTWN